MVISEAKLSDLPECAALIRRSFGTVAEKFGITKENAPRFTAFAVDETLLGKHYHDPKRALFKCVSDGKIVGYFSLEKLSDTEVEINHLCVDPDYRKGGIGAKLLDHALNHAAANGFRLVKISIVEENQVLRKWYESFGFVHTGTVKYDFFPFTCGYLEKQI